MSQLALDLAHVRRAHRDDPQTSRDAARAATSTAQAHYDRILAVLDRGMTIYEIAEASRLSHVQVARRLPELATAGVVRRREVGLQEDGSPTYATRPSPSGRACAVWERAP